MKAWLQLTKAGIILYEYNVFAIRPAVPLARDVASSVLTTQKGVRPCILQQTRLLSAKRSFEKRIGKELPLNIEKKAFEKE